VSSASELVTVSVEEGFRRWAEVYDETPNPLLSLEERLLAPMLADLRGRTVVDVGCGTGRWLSRLSGRGAHALIGIDRSPAMLQRARRKPGPEAALFCADSCSLPVRRNTADFILCSFTLGYIADVAALARELKRVAKPGAEILISDFHPGAHRRGWRRAFRCGTQQLEIENFERPLDELTAAFRNAGLGLLEMVEARFGEPERASFVAAGREHLFAQAAEGPAIFVARFRRPLQRQSAFPTEQPGRFAIRRVRVANDANTATTADLAIDESRIVSSGSQPGVVVDLSGYLLLPGLINAHDHLEFNLFPRLGHGTYPNFLEWAADIHHRHHVAIGKHRALDQSQRLHWGAIKNLLSGVTSVAHHNPYEADVFDADFPLRVVCRFGWAHSLALETDVQCAFQATPPGAPFVVHLGEGTDAASAAELEELDHLGLLGPQTVIVHGVALTSAQRRLLRQRGAALVWCPSSNLFTLGRTHSADELNECGRVALGTDSALTGQGNLRDEIGVAHSLGISAERLYEMVTTSAADVLCLREGEGTLKSGAVADVIAVRDHGLSPAETLCALSEDDIELVVAGGSVRMISPDLAHRWPMPLPRLEEICVDGVRRLVAASITDLLAAARLQLGSEIQLAHRQVAP
jgi:cytosine/adenosine deaminase-related metal-dependent hydrolase/ubiquinone/menaquinone biosynthesis C-methylase UbiE